MIVLWSLNINIWIWTPPPNYKDAVLAICDIYRKLILVIVTFYRFSTDHDTATWPSDFTAIFNSEIVFSPGESLKQMTLTIVNDDVVESTERFSVALSTVDGKVSIGTFGTATVSILDNDSKCILKRKL